jgi:uncharacterized membrane protein
MHYFPITLPFLLVFAVFLAFLIILVEIGILRYAYHKIGIGQRHMFLLLALSFFGSYINIPVWQLSPHAIASPGVVSFGGINYVVPMLGHTPGTIIALNLGGAIIPACLSIYLLLKNRLFGRGILGILVMTIAVHAVAEPVKGVGIALPVLFPPIVAALVGLILSRRYAPPLAYVSGSLGTLIGADLLNMDKVQALGAPVASIGGAGTFDGIFLTGILSVLLAGIFTRQKNS